MINGQSVIAVIPARGGSKRLPDKNLKRYHGKTLIEWAIIAAQRSKYLDAFCVSSDSAPILGLARELGALALERPDWLATDQAMTEGAMIHHLYTWRWADWAVLLQPTSPLRTSEHIDDCIKAAQGFNGCLTVDERGQRNGAVYVIKSEILVSGVTFTERQIDRVMEMPNSLSLDINYAVDLIK